MPSAAGSARRGSSPSARRCSPTGRGAPRSSAQSGSHGDAHRRARRSHRPVAKWQSAFLNEEDSPVTARQVSRFGSGYSVKRVEDDALLRGAGRFADNLPAAGQLHACFVRSPRPHARIARIDIDAAVAMPGVARILTGRNLLDAGVRPIPHSTDFKRKDGAPTATPLRHALAVDTVRYVGEAVVAVIAATPHEARDAADAVQVDYEPLPAVVDAVAAAAPGAPTVVAEAPDNIACEARHGDPAAAAAAFDRAKHVVTIDLVNQRVAHCSIEPRSTLATY